MTNYIGTAGNDHLTGSGGADHFDLTLGGHDTAKGLALSDVFDMGTTFDARDRLFGGDGYDTVILQGDYAFGLTLAAKSLNSIEEIDLLGNFNYGLILTDANIAAHQSLTFIVGGNTSTVCVIDASAETNGNLVAHGHDGQDTFHGGAGDDVLDGSGGGDLLTPGSGTDTVYGGSGVDNLYFLDNLDSTDFVDAGADVDYIIITGNYTQKVVVGAGQWTGVEFVYFGGSGAYSEAFNLDLSHSLIASMYIDYTGGGSLTFTARKANADGFTVNGGRGDDDITGSNGHDFLRGNAGADRLEGGQGVDVYIYRDAADSHGTHYDDIVGFDAADDFIDSQIGDFGEPEYSGVVTRGPINADTFNADVEAALAHNRLPFESSVLLHPKSGDMKGEWFLVIDGNGVAGYQTNEDVIIHFVNPHGMANFSVLNFFNPDG